MFRNNAGSNKGDQQRSACKVNRAARMRTLRLRKMMNDASVQLDCCGQVLEKKQRDRKSCAPSAFRPGVDFQCRGKRRVDWPIACSFCQQLASYRRGPLTEKLNQHSQASRTQRCRRCARDLRVGRIIAGHTVGLVHTHQTKRDSACTTESTRRCESLMMYSIL